MSTLLVSAPSYVSLHVKSAQRFARQCVPYISDEACVLTYVRCCTCGPCCLDVLILTASGGCRSDSMALVRRLEYEMRLHTPLTDRWKH